jgi:hypothetical protein
MFDFGLGSIQSRPLEELVGLLLVMAVCIGAIILIGFDTIIIALVIRYAIPVVAELARRAWYRVKSRLCTPR